MTVLRLTHAEVIWLTDCVGQFSSWPPDERAYRVVPLEKRDDGSLGPLFRLKLIAALRKGMRAVDPGESVIEVSLEELWFLDAFLAQYPLRHTYLTREESLLGFALKVWDLLIEEYKDELPSDLLSKPADYTNTASGALDEVERLLRSTVHIDREDGE